MRALNGIVAGLGTLGILFGLLQPASIAGGYLIAGAILIGAGMLCETIARQPR